MRTVCTAEICRKELLACPHSSIIPTHPIHPGEGAVGRMSTRVQLQFLLSTLNSPLKRGDLVSPLELSLPIPSNGSNYTCSNGQGSWNRITGDEMPVRTTCFHTHPHPVNSCGTATSGWDLGFPAANDLRQEASMGLHKGWEHPSIPSALREVTSLP